MPTLDDTRRRFMAHFAGIGLGATVVPGVIWARMQDAQADRITLAMVTEALKLSGLEVSEADRPAQRHSTMANLACYPAINVPNGFTPEGLPTNATFFARPFGEGELLALAKAYQDAAGFHLKKPTKLEQP